jgi:hypothetical protein
MRDIEKRHPKKESSGIDKWELDVFFSKLSIYHLWRISTTDDIQLQQMIFI